MIRLEHGSEADALMARRTLWIGYERVCDVIDYEFSATSRSEE